MGDTESQASEGAIVSVTIGCDWRIYCHDIAPELMPVLAELCSDDKELVSRDALIVKEVRANE